MATKDYTQGGDTGQVYGGSYGLNVRQKTIDFAKDNATAADVLQIFKVGANTWVDRVAVIVHTAQGSAGNIDVGDGSDVDGYIVDRDVNATGATVSTLALTEGTPNTVTGYSGGKFYTAADTIDAIPSINLTAAKITFVMFSVCLEADLY